MRRCTKHRISSGTDDKLKKHLQHVYILEEIGISAAFLLLSVPKETSESAFVSSSVPRSLSFNLI